MPRLLRLLAIAILLLASIANAEPSVRKLVHQLENGQDFRVRVQAALELGKTRSDRARVPLERALGDTNAAVRAAAAAALKVLGDSRSVAALKRHRKDSSAAVRSQVKASIAALEAQTEKTDSEPAKVLVQLGKISAKDSVIGQIKRTSRLKLGQLPGVQVLEETSDPKSQAEHSSLPVVMLTGRLRKLNTKQDGEVVIYSASVEYVVHKMPDRVIAGTVSGSASTRVSVAEDRDKRRSAELKLAVLDAAIASAIRRAPDALLAAAK